ncbi:MAG TPA: DUF5335 family protein [Pyrinomonadaceae bacterium]|jgi:hypothetical protein
MSTQEIPREEWNSFFDSFSRQHEGWLATLEVLHPDIGAQQEARALPLEGISHASRSNTIAISLGRTAADHVTHTIADAEHVRLETTDEGANAALEIEAKDDSKALLRFRSAVPPEFVDGVVLE